MGAPESPILSSQARHITQLSVSAYTIPTEQPEADGERDWDSTPLVLVEAQAGDQIGIGYAYAPRATAQFIHDVLAPIVEGSDALALPATWQAMLAASTPSGNAGIGVMAVSAVDCALWDLKAKLLGLPLIALLGEVREGVGVYASGGFTSLATKQLQEQLESWVAQGFRRVKMQIGRHPVEDFARVGAARTAVGNDIELYVDASGAYTPKQALTFANAFADTGIRWFEDPVARDDVAGLRYVRDRAPPETEIAAGERFSTLPEFILLMETGAVDVVQADATRCGGITGLLLVAALCEAKRVPLSLSGAPALHLHAACALRPVRHLDYFHDHARIEHMLFDGAVSPISGMLYPDLSRPGFGIAFRRADGARYAA